MVSSKLTGEMVAIMQVLVRPPRESCKSRVSLDSLNMAPLHEREFQPRRETSNEDKMRKELTDRYGICVSFSTSLLITRPRASRLALIIPASLALPFSAPLRPTFSDPARSTRLSLPTLSISSPPVLLDSLMCTVMLKME